MKSETYIDVAMQLDHNFLGWDDVSPEAQMAGEKTKEDMEHIDEDLSKKETWGFGMIYKIAKAIPRHHPNLSPRAQFNVFVQLRKMARDNFWDQAMVEMLIVSMRRAWNSKIYSQ